MNPVIARTLFGLKASFYFRQLLIACALSAIVILVVILMGSTLSTDMLLLVITNTLLYPYSRFAFACLVDAVVIFLINRRSIIIFDTHLFILKVLRTLLCWSLALVIAPWGLLYMYYFNTKPA